MKTPGAGFETYGQPSKFESKVARTIAPLANPATQGVGTARTPLHLLDGVITPVRDCISSAATPAFRTSIPTATVS